MLHTAIARARRVRQDREGGFTLIELLMVIVILGILAGIVVFSVAGITDRGKTSACKAEVSTVQTAEEAYYAKTGGYGTLAQLQASPNAFLHSGTPTYVTAASATDGTLTLIASPPSGCTA